MRPRAEIDRRVGAIAELLQLTPLLDRKADRLSVNILQRVAIGRSAIMEPAIFLLDEPLSNVDAAFRAVMRTELKQLQRQFRQTMVYVTHDQLEAMTMADRIAVMDHGVLQQVGTPLEVYNNPANVFVARFIGAPGMNLLKGRRRKATAGWSSISARWASRRRCRTRSPRPLRGARGEVFYGFRPEQVRWPQTAAACHAGHASSSASARAPSSISARARARSRRCSTMMSGWRSAQTRSLAPRAASSVRALRRRQRRRRSREG